MKTTEEFFGEICAPVCAGGGMTDAETQAIWNALAQYVENGDCSEAPEKDRHLEAARSAMEKLDAAMAKAVR